MDIRQYLKEKLKEKNLHLDDFIAQSGASKSTIYRIMTGAQKPSKSLEKKMIEILDLNHTEQQMLHYYFSITDIDENIIQSREAVHQLLFNKENSPPKKIELVYYDEEKYIRTFDYILDKVVEASKEKHFTCEFKVVNCIQKDIISPLAKVATSLLEGQCNCAIEHLINFSTHDYKENIHTLAKVIPLLTLENYSLNYREEDNVSKDGFFHDFMALRYSFHNGDRKSKEVNLHMTFLPHNLSACYVVKENQDHAHDFFQRSYNALKEQYPLALSNRRPFTASMNTAKEPFRNGDFTGFGKQLDLYTKVGLAQFASTGLFMNPLEGEPAYSKNEVKSHLETLKAKDQDPEDPFHFFILKDTYATENLSFITGDHCCAIIEKHVDSSTPFCAFQHEKLSAIFADFAYNYVPIMMAIPQVEAYDYIDSLLEKYCEYT